MVDFCGRDNIVVINTMLKQKYKKTIYLEVIG